MSICYQCWSRPSETLEGEYCCNTDPYNEETLKNKCPRFLPIDFDKLLIFIRWTHGKEESELFLPGDHGLPYQYQRFYARKVERVTLFGRGIFDQKHIRAAHRYARRMLGKQGHSVCMTPDVQKALEKR